jgi:hypothetical protein
MTDLTLATKAGLAVMLVVAGAAKLSDLRSFAVTIRLFAPRRTRMWGLRTAPLVIVSTELVLGTVSLSFPTLNWINIVVVGLAFAFVAVAAYGYAFYRGRSCTCFGALSARSFDAAGIVRSVAILAAALVALGSVPAVAVDLRWTERVLLLGCSGILALVSFTASRALALARSVQGGVASS